MVATFGDCLLYLLFIILWRMLRCGVQTFQSRTYRYGPVPKLSSVDARAVKILQQQLKEWEIHELPSFHSCLVIFLKNQKFKFISGEEVEEGGYICICFRGEYQKSKITVKRKVYLFRIQSSQVSSIGLVWLLLGHYSTSREGLEKRQLFHNYCTDQIHIPSQVSMITTRGALTLGNDPPCH